MRVVLFALLSLVFLSSCGDYNKVFKSQNTTLKYSKALELYNKKDYTRALTLFDQLREYYKSNSSSTDSLENVYYYTAYSHFELKDYQFASLFFKDFTENFTRSKRLIECAYMAINCDVLSIGSYELDQSNTRKVIEELQTFINYYPLSSYVPRCNEHIETLRGKLEKKEYEWVIQYFDQGHYRAAVVSARNTLKSYPDIPQREELEFMTIKAQYLYAVNSIEKKRLERLKGAIDNYNEYFYIYGTKGVYARQAQEYKDKIENAIQKLKQTI